MPKLVARKPATSPSSLRRAMKKEIAPYQRHPNVYAVPPSFKFECAGCGFTHANKRSGSNYWHEECLVSHNREFHNPPEHLLKQSQLRLSMPIPSNRAQE